MKSRLHLPNFTASRDFKRPLRAMLTDLQTIEEVRLIESAGK